MKMNKEMIEFQNTLVRATDGNEAPIKNPKTTPIIVVSTSLVLSMFDFLSTPLPWKRAAKKIALLWLGLNSSL